MIVATRWVQKTVNGVLSTLVVRRISHFSATSRDSNKVPTSVLYTEPTIYCMVFLAAIRIIERSLLASLSW